MKRFNVNIVTLATVLTLISCGNAEQTEDPGNQSLVPDTATMQETASGNEMQAEQPSFSKRLSLQNISFEISTEKSSSGNRLNITPSGLSGDNSPISMELEGAIIDAEIEDLDADGSPEVMVYTKSGADDIGNVLGVSVNAGKSASFFYFPPTSDNPKINNGYTGHDQFTLVENYLAQRFPLYANGQPTGKIRQVTYQLAKGENGKIFKVHDVNEFDNP